jgi:tRNA modification GTPase
MDTIYALATARGKAGVSVIRVSGPDAFNVCRQLARDVPLAGQHRLMALRALDGQLLDKALVLAFAAPNSFTGENIVEFQVHGSSAVVQAVQSSLVETQLCRLAEPGEFTRRAMLNNKLDLAQVEGLGDLIEAETEVQRRQAMNVFTGKLTRTFLLM